MFDKSGSVGWISFEADKTSNSFVGVVGSCVSAVIGFDNLALSGVGGL